MATRTWSGAVSSVTNHTGNWEEGIIPIAGDALVFPGGGATNKTLTNDITADTSFSSISISGNDYDISGNGITLAGDATISGYNAIVRIAIILTADVTLNVVHDLELRGIISGSNGLAIIGGASVLMNAANTFSGPLTIKSGEVSAVSQNTALGAGTVVLGDASGGSNSASLKVAITSTNPLVLASTTTGGLKLFTQNGAEWRGGITGTNNLTLQSTGDYNGLDITTGAVNFTGTLNITSTKAPPVTISSVVGTSVSAIVQNAASGVTVLSGTNTYTGPITNTAGTLSLTNNGTYSTLTLGPGSTTTITNGKTLTLTSLISNGTLGSLATINCSSTAGAGIFTTATETITVDYVSIRDNNPVETNTWYVGPNSTLVTNTGNWLETQTAGPPSDVASASVLTNGSTITFSFNANEAGCSANATGFTLTSVLTINSAISGVVISAGTTSSETGTISLTNPVPNLAGHLAFSTGGLTNSEGNLVAGSVTLTNNSTYTAPITVSATITGVDETLIVGAPSAWAGAASSTVMTINNGTENAFVSGQTWPGLSVGAVITVLEKSGTVTIALGSTTLTAPTLTLNGGTVGTCTIAQTLTWSVDKPWVGNGTLTLVADPASAMTLSTASIVTTSTTGTLTGTPTWPKTPTTITVSGTSSDYEFTAGSLTTTSIAYLSVTTSESGADVVVSVTNGDAENGELTIDGGAEVFVMVSLGGGVFSYTHDGGAAASHTYQVTLTAGSGTEVVGYGVGTWYYSASGSTLLQRRRRREIYRRALRGGL